ncbi:MAG: hypothetical protein KDK78_02875 [Chlamydiia bacterium]|nr:hypothetical protein [Chlamydiia bacterium]
MVWKKVRNLGIEAYYDLKSYPTCWVHHLAGATPLVKAWGVNPQCLSQEQLSKRPVIFLHGCFANQGCWRPLLKDLSKAPLGPFFSFNYSGIEQGLDRLQQTLEQVQQLYTRHGVPEVEVDLVGHSLGAITSAYYALLHTHALPPGLRIRRVISVAGRLRIQETSWDFPYRDIRGFIDQIHESYIEGEHDLDLHVVAGSADRLVPIESVCIHDDPTRTLVVPNRGHLAVLYSSAFGEKLLEWLKD